MIQYKHYAIIFGGITAYNKNLCDFWFIDLNTFVCKKWFESKILKNDNIKWNYYYDSPPQLLNDDTVIYKPYNSSEYFYFIDLSKCNMNDKNYNKYEDWDKKNYLIMSLI